MYSFLVVSAPVNALVKSEEAYEFFTYRGAQPVEIQYRGKPIEVKKGQRFGVRPSANKKSIRLVLGDDISRVITLTMDQAKQLAKGIKK